MTELAFHASLARHLGECRSCRERALAALPFEALADVFAHWELWEIQRGDPTGHSPADVGPARGRISGVRPDPAIRRTIERRGP